MVITTICLYFANTIRFGNAATATATAAVDDDDDVLVNIGVRTKHFPIETRTENRHYRITEKKLHTTYANMMILFSPFVLILSLRIPVVAK